MELEKFVFGESNCAQKADASNGENQSGTSASLLLSDSEASLDDLSVCSESFSMRNIEAPRTISAKKKLSWLRSQIVGRAAEFSSPFGIRRITYADHNPSGQGLDYIKNYSKLSHLTSDKRESSSHNISMDSSQPSSHVLKL